MKDNDDRRLAVYFDRLRRAQQSQVPAFSRVLKDATDTRSTSMGLIPAIGLAVAVLTLSIMVMFAVYPGISGDRPDPLADQPQVIDLDIWELDEEMPTDFLLDTPWSQMASLDIPEQLLEQHYEILEELTDES